MKTICYFMLRSKGADGSKGGSPYPAGHGLCYVLRREWTSKNHNSYFIYNYDSLIREHRSQSNARWKESVVCPPGKPLFEECFPE